MQYSSFDIYKMIKKKKPKTNHKKQKSNRRFKANISKAKSHQYKTKTHYKNSNYIKKPIWNIILNCFLVLFTGSLAFYTAKLFYSADESIRLTNRIANTQEKFSKIEMRAYVIMDNIKIVTFEIGKNIGIEYIVQNIGRTPAYKAKRIVCSKAGQFTKQEMLDMKPAITEQGSIFGAGIPYIESADGFYVSADLFNAIKNSSDTLHIAILFTYKDIFSEPHYTRTYIRWIEKQNKIEFMYQYNDAN